MTDERVVAVTGASGFIGARLVAMLRSATPPVRVRTLSRRGAGGVDLADPGAVASALDGCHVLVHCAFDFSDLEANVAIARTLAGACAAGGMRMVQVSTAAVYEPFPDGALDETVCVAHPGSHYKQVKLRIEQEVLRLVREAALEAVILQPTVVYGPQGRAWTDSPIRELLTGTVVLPDGGDGSCNAVFVDDVCRAIVAASQRPLPPGERILISGAQPVRWREFYGEYQRMLGLDALVLQPGTGDPAPASDEPIPATPSAAARVKRVATRLLGARAMAQANLALNFARGLVQSRRHVATGAKLALFRSRGEVRIDKARRLLGYEPQWDLADGMRSTRPYVEERYGRLARLKRGRWPSASPSPSGLGPRIGPSLEGEEGRGA